MSSAGLPSTGWLLLVQAEAAYCTYVPYGRGLGAGAPCGMLWCYRRLCRRQQVLYGPHLPAFRLQLGPVSFGNITEKEPNTRFTQKYVRTRNWSPQDVK